MQKKKPPTALRKESNNAFADKRAPSQGLAIKDSRAPDEDGDWLYDDPEYDEYNY